MLHCCAAFSGKQTGKTIRLGFLTPCENFRLIVGASLLESHFSLLPELGMRLSGLTPIRFVELL